MQKIKNERRKKYTTFNVFVHIQNLYLNIETFGLKQLENNSMSISICVIP